MVCQEYTYVYGAASIESGQLDSLILPNLNSECMQIFVDMMSSRYPEDRILMVLDRAGWHRVGKLVPPKNMRFLYLPPNAPELNPMENIWDELKEKNFTNLVFPSLNVLQEELIKGLRHLEENPQITKSIVQWPWIIAAIPINPKITRKKTSPKKKL
jgi:hypothetical protein